MESTNRKSLEFANQSARTPREPSQSSFLGHLAEGESIDNARTLAGSSRAAYEKWRTRDKTFSASVEAICGAHHRDPVSRDALSSLHDAETYARILLDAIQRDEALPAALRFRAATFILSRKGKSGWLPEPLPADERPLDAGGEDSTAGNALRAAESDTVPDIRGGFKHPGPYEVRGGPGVFAGREACREHPQNAAIPDPCSPLPNPLRSQVEAGAAVSLTPADFIADPGPAATSGPAASSAPPAASSHSSPEFSALSTRLRAAWLHPCFLYKHESPKAFGKLLERQLSVWRPATPIEERLVFRLAQAAWRIERADTLERVLADSAITQLRERHPAIPVAAALALHRHETGNNSATRLHDRLAEQRRKHQAHEDRLESRLLGLQRQRETASRHTTVERQPTVRFRTAANPKVQSGA